MYPGRYPLDDLEVDFGKYLALHIRHGDSCTTRDINVGRPPCQDPKEFVEYLLTMENILGHAIHQIYVASDEQKAIYSFISELGNSSSVKRNILALNEDHDLYNPQGNSKIETVIRPEIQRKIFNDFVGDVLMIAGGSIVLGDCYSSMFNMAFFMKSEKGYHCIDKAYPCLRGGCPSPITKEVSRSCTWMKDIFDSVRHYESVEPLYRNIYDVTRSNFDYCNPRERYAPNWENITCVGEMQEENQGVCLQQLVIDDWF